jgi:predicted nucleic acid-binding protein
MKALILDANILVRAVLGTRVPTLLSFYGQQHVRFMSAAICYEEVRRHLPLILQKRNLPLEPFFESLEAISRIVTPIEEEVYKNWEEEAKQRIERNDIHDWPIVALSLTFDCPVWTEDKDFFGTGIATWQTHNIEIYLSGIN